MSTTKQGFDHMYECERDLDYSHKETRLLYINYQNFLTVGFRTLKVEQKDRYFGRFLKNISDKIFTEFTLFSPDFGDLSSFGNSY